MLSKLYNNNIPKLHTIHISIQLKRKREEDQNLYNILRAPTSDILPSLPKRIVNDDNNDSSTITMPYDNDNTNLTDASISSTTNSITKSNSIKNKKKNKKTDKHNEIFSTFISNYLSDKG